MEKQRRVAATSRPHATLQEQLVLVDEMEGVEGVVAFARALRWPFRMCQACETETPVVDDGCGCCGEGAR